MKNVDHSYEQALIMHDNVHIHIIMNIIVTPTLCVWLLLILVRIVKRMMMNELEVTIMFMMT